MYRRNAAEKFKSIKRYKEKKQITSEGKRIVATMNKEIKEIPTQLSSPVDEVKSDHCEKEDEVSATTCVDFRKGLCKCEKPYRKRHLFCPNGSSCQHCDCEYLHEWDSGFRFTCKRRIDRCGFGPSCFFRQHPDEDYVYPCNNAGRQRTEDGRKNHVMFDDESIINPLNLVSTCERFLSREMEKMNEHMDYRLRYVLECIETRLDSIQEEQTILRQEIKSTLNQIQNLIEITKHNDQNDSRKKCCNNTKKNIFRKTTKQKIIHFLIRKMYKNVRQLSAIGVIFTTVPVGFLCLFLIHSKLKTINR